MTFMPNMKQSYQENDNFKQEGGEEVAIVEGHVAVDVD